MDWWAWTLLVLAVVVLAAWVSNVKIQIFYSRVEDNDRFYVLVRGLYGLVRYKYEVPIIKFRGLHKGIDFKSEKVNELNSSLIDESVGNIDREKILRYYDKFKRALQATFDMKEWVKDTLAQTCCTDMKWITRVGIGDAPETAITTGLVWTVKSSILGYLFKFIKRDVKPDIRVIPMYNQTVFSTEISCIAQIRLGQAIFAGLHLLVRIMKVKGGIKAWQNILSKAS
ncbi:DUF2953 domain-containing protein [Gorillibacterium sp. sgz5001074]|uniref:DUF2953 domain-containing protein n=1 Tax=Gorillibacterium sp. sgz5001074 TaxID=3446695 RepID=UPI003F663B2D